MNNIKKIQYIKFLEMKKNQLEINLENVNKDIKKQKDSCIHLGVNLGYYGLYPSSGNKYICLMCGKGKDGEYFAKPKYIIHAENYLTQYDIIDEEQCNEKFDNIQTLTLGLLKENPDMSIEELSLKLNNLIQKSISSKENQDSPKLVKTKE